MFEHMVAPGVWHWVSFGVRPRVSLGVRHRLLLALELKSILEASLFQSSWHGCVSARYLASFSRQGDVWTSIAGNLDIFQCDRRSLPVVSLNFTMLHFQPEVPAESAGTHDS